jgi:hypothetical protein
MHSVRAMSSSIHGMRLLFLFFLFSFFSCGVCEVSSDLPLHWCSGTKGHQPSSFLLSPVGSATRLAFELCAQQSRLVTLASHATLRVPSLSRDSGPPTLEQTFRLCGSRSPVQCIRDVQQQRDEQGHYCLKGEVDMQLDFHLFDTETTINIQDKKLNTLTVFCANQETEGTQ